MSKNEMFLKLSLMRADGRLVHESVNAVRAGKFKMQFDTPGGALDDEIELYEVTVNPSFKFRERTDERTGLRD